jgi:hypothetical protein
MILTKSFAPSSDNAGMFHALELGLAAIRSGKWNVLSGRFGASRYARRSNEVGHMCILTLMGIEAQISGQFSRQIISV